MKILPFRHPHVISNLTFFYRTHKKMVGNQTTLDSIDFHCMGTNPVRHFPYLCLTVIYSTRFKQHEGECMSFV